jgi:hypothetical protein
MQPGESPGPTRVRGGRRLLVVAAAASVVAMGAGTALVAGLLATTTASGSARVASASASVAPPAVRSTSWTEKAAPPSRVPSYIGSSGSRLLIPVLRVDAPLVPEGAVGAPGTAALSIPNDIHTVGWWDGLVNDSGRTVTERAPRPGQPGVAIIAGHVDSAAAGPGALYDLKDLRVGATIEIADSHHHLSRWRVDARPQLTAKTSLPSALWVRGGPARLAIISCGGPFDAATGHYIDNVVVWATPR